MSKRKELTLFHRIGCHLCDQMLSDLQPYIESNEVILKLIDIDEDPKWTQRYNTLIPVLHADSEPMCKYYLDKERLESFLAE